MTKKKNASRRQGIPNGDVPSFLALNNYLVPMFGAFWGILILSERPGPNTGIAFLVVLAGIFICQGGISRSVIAIRRWRTRDKVNTGVL